MDDAHKISITICGDGGCGKSSITLRLVRSQWTNEYDPTIEDSYAVTRTIDGTTYSLSLTDTAGQEEYRGLWSASNLRCDAFLLVYDITNPDSLPQLEHFDGLIAMERDARRERLAALHARNTNINDLAAHAQPAPVCIVAGNKCDLQARRRVPARAGLDWARARGYGFMETSAREMVNIEETFALIVRRTVEARRRQQEALAPKPAAPSAPITGVAAARGFAGPPASTSRTTPLPPPLVDEKAAQGTTSGWLTERQPWWRKLRCW